MTEEGRQPTDSALRKVLEAERGARARIAEAEENAAAALEAARADARRIESDAVAAARAFQETCADQTEDRVAHLRDAAEQRLGEIESESVMPRIEAAAETVARELLGTQSGDENGRAAQASG